MRYTKTNEYIDPETTNSWFLMVKSDVSFDIDIEKVHTLIITYYNHGANIIALDDNGKEVKVTKEGTAWGPGSFQEEVEYEVLIFNHKETGSTNWKKVESLWNK